jgi:hypothetical protein
VAPPPSGGAYPSYPEYPERQPPDGTK